MSVANKSIILINTHLSYLATRYHRVATNQTLAVLQTY